LKGLKSAEEAAQRAEDDASAARQSAAETQAQYEAQQQTLEKQQAEAAAENKKLRDQVAALESMAQQLDLPALQRLTAQEKMHELMRSQFDRIMNEPAVKNYYTVSLFFLSFSFALL